MAGIGTNHNHLNPKSVQHGQLIKPFNFMMKRDTAVNFMECASIPGGPVILELDEVGPFAPDMNAASLSKQKEGLVNDVQEFRGGAVAYGRAILFGNQALTLVFRKQSILKRAVEKIIGAEPLIHATLQPRWEADR